MSDIYVCAECHRIMDKTTVVDSGIGRVELPVPHRNRDGEPCPGVGYEVIIAWRGKVRP
jgi:hypothetical protein